MCSRNVNNAAKLCSSQVHSNSAIHAPESLFTFSQLWTDWSHCSLFSAIGLSLLQPHGWTNLSLLAPMQHFLSSFLDGTVCGEMSQWIPVILLSHSQAAGSHARKLSIQPKSGKGFHHRHLLKCIAECRKSLTNTYRKQTQCFSNNKEATCYFIG